MSVRNALDMIEQSTCLRFVHDPLAEHDVSITYIRHYIERYSSTNAHTIINQNIFNFIYALPAL